MEPTSDWGKKKQIYTIIMIGVIGFVGIIWRVITNRNGPFSMPSQDKESVITNNILDTTRALPTVCQNVIDIMNCIISKIPKGDNPQSLNLFYQQTLSERNILDKDNLEKSCMIQKKYFDTLQWEYKDIILSCKKNKP